MYCFVVKSYCSSLHFGLINSFLQELCPWNLNRISDFFSFPDVFFTIFADIGLKLGVLLCSQETELLFQIEFQCDWFLFVRVTPLHLW